MSNDFGKCATCKSWRSIDPDVALVPVGFGECVNPDVSVSILSTSKLDANDVVVTLCNFGCRYYEADPVIDFGGD